MTATEIKKPNDLLGKDENFNEELFITNDEFIKDDIHKYLDKTPRDEEAMWINVRIDDGQTLFRCCTGTSTTFITEEFADILKLKIEFGKLTFIFTPTGTITTKWFTKVKLEIGDQIFEHSLPVIRYRKFPHQVLGWDLITKLNCLFDFQNSKILRRENDEYKEIGKITKLNKEIDENEENMKKELKEFIEIEVEPNVKQKIETRTAEPSVSIAIDIPIHQQDKVNEIIDNMLKNKIIEKSESEWRSPLIVEETEDKKLRISVDYSKINSQIIQNEIFNGFNENEYQKFLGSKYFSTIRISEYHQIPINDEDKPKTAFITNRGIFQFRKIPFGLNVKTKIIFTYLKDILKSTIDKFCLVYLNCIFIYSPEINIHKEHLKKIIKLLENGGISINYKDCEFFRKEFYYKEYIVSDLGLKICPKRIERLKNFPFPIFNFEMEMFLKYLKKDEKFIENDFKINLKDIYKPNYIFLRTEEATKAFKDLKEYLETDPTLFYLVPSLETYLIIDLDLEANHIMDVSVMQWNLKNNIRWPIGYYQFDSDAEYKKLDEQHDNDTQYYNGRQRKRNTYPESNVAYCFMKAIKRFEHYLLETEFRILCKKKNKYVEYFTTSTTDNYHNEFFEKFEFSFWFN